MKIHKIYTMKGEYEDVLFYGVPNTFKESIEEGKVVEIVENDKSIYINSNYIISYEI